MHTLVRALTVVKSAPQLVIGRHRGGVRVAMTVGNTLVQGSTEAALLASLMLRRSTERIKTMTEGKVPFALVIDDWTLQMNAGQLSTVMPALIQSLADDGYAVSRNKTKILWASYDCDGEEPTSNEYEEAKAWADDNSFQIVFGTTRLLGAPLGGDEVSKRRWIQLHLSKQVGHLIEVLRSKDLSNTARTKILQAGMLPKLQYVMRTNNPGRLSGVINYLERITEEIVVMAMALEEGDSLPERVYEDVCQPLRFGGSGIGNYKDKASAAFIASRSWWQMTPLDYMGITRMASRRWRWHLRRW
jgi:hypothetical protein